MMMIVNNNYMVIQFIIPRRLSSGTSILRHGFWLIDLDLQLHYFNTVFSCSITIFSSSSSCHFIKMRTYCGLVKRTMIHKIYDVTLAPLSVVFYDLKIIIVECNRTCICPKGTFAHSFGILYNMHHVKSSSSSSSSFSSSMHTTHFHVK